MWSLYLRALASLFRRGSSAARRCLSTALRTYADIEKNGALRGRGRHKVGTYHHDVHDSRPGMRTYQTRLRLSMTQSGEFAAYAQRFGHALHRLHADRCAGRRDDKPAFMRKFGLTARQYNAVRVTLDAITAGLRERLPRMRDELRDRIASLRRRYSKTADAAKRHQLRRKLARLEHRLAERSAQIDAPVPSICFGSCELFRAQHSLEANGYADHAAWLQAWRDTRSAQFFVLGSKDETAGCQGCVVRHLGDGCFAFRLRLPNATSEKYLHFEAAFAYGWEQLVWALEVGQALSYRFRRDAKGWQVFASTAVIPVAISSDLRAGALGVDLNADHVAVTRCDPRGNLTDFKPIPLVTYGASRERAKALLGDAVKNIVAIAAAARIPIVVEQLDFARKKARLREFGRRYARMLSSFAYKRFVQFLCARAHDAGIEVRFVNPAYSSLIGKHKFVRRYGISGHLAAALVLARRAQGYSERPNRQDRNALGSPVRMNARHVWSFWAGVARKTAWVAPRQRPSSVEEDPPVAAAAGLIMPLFAGGSPARESAASTVRAASLAS